MMEFHLPSTKASSKGPIRTFNRQYESSPNRVRAASRFVMDTAQHIEIRRSKVPRMVERIDEWNAKPWIHVAPVRFDDLDSEARLAVALIFNAISFCYWPAPWWDNKWYESDVRRGSWALLGFLRHAINNRIPVLSPRFLSSLDVASLEGLLSGHGRLSLLERRAEILREIGTIIENDLGGRVGRLVELAGYNAPRLVDAVLMTFPSFKDEANLDGRTVPFAKRAQLFAADCHRILEKGCGQSLTGFGELTACADYMIPALLAKEGVLVYAWDLQEAIRRQIPLPAGERYEVEIRAATVVACDLIAESWGRPPMLVNDALWEKAGTVFAVTPTHHRTWTEAY